MLAHFTFVDVKNITTKQEYSRHVIMLAARTEISPGYFSEKNIKNKRVFSPAVDISVRLTRTSIDLKLQYCLLTIKYNATPTTNAVRSKMKSMIISTKKIFTDAPSLRKIIEQYPLVVVKAVLVTARSNGMDSTVHTVDIKAISETYLHINFLSNIGPSDFTLYVLYMRYMK